jgi:ribonuclease T2
MNARRWGKLALAVVGSLFLAAGAQSPAIDSYVLALTWAPSFCEFNASRWPECRDIHETDFAATHLVIHGLWPDSRESTGLSYCGVDTRLQQVDLQNRWCELPKPQVSAETRTELERAMPGVHSCLDRHEWIVHGTCSGTSAESYFATTLRLAAAVDEASLGKFLAANAGRTVARQQIIDAFEADYGPGAGKSLTLLCKPRGTESLLIEIRLTLEASAMDDAFGAEDLCPAAPQARGSCPAAVLIDPLAH